MIHLELLNLMIMFRFRSENLSENLFFAFKPFERELENEPVR